MIENEAKELKVRIEDYLELKGADGDIDFIVLRSTDEPYTGKPSPIKAVQPLALRRSGE